LSIELFRIDDRLIHGQVVVGWGQPLEIDLIVLVDDEVAASDWEQELYRMGVPPDMQVVFETVASAAANLATHEARDGRAILLTADIDTMRRLVESGAHVPAVNVGGIHHREGRTQRLRYVFLAPEEAESLRAIARSGVRVTARDVPAAREVSLEEIITGEAS
jgi:PTS system mannose-specific IIB component/fructoselysine and glucoselysine-specific PTS system IIB component